MHKVLFVLSAIEIGDKIREHNGTLHLDKDCMLQPVSRSIYNMWYGGANRVHIITYIKAIRYQIQFDFDDNKKSLERLLVKQNILTTDESQPDFSLMLNSIKELNISLPNTVMGLMKLQITYKDDDLMCRQLKQVTSEFVKLEMDVNIYVHTLNQKIIKDYLELKNIEWG